MKRFIVVYFLFSLFFFSFFASGFVDSQDGLQYLTTARRLYYNHTFTMPTTLWPDNLHMSVTKANNGMFYGPGGLGYTVMYLPAVMVEDVFLQLSGLEAESVFPLKNDWPVLLAASMVNAVWGALLVVVLYLYLRSMAMNHRISLWLSFILVLSTNVFVYTKHAFPHMMFVSLLTLAFYLVRRHAQTHRGVYLLAAGLAYGGVIISYNPTFLFPVPALGLYYLAHHWQIKQIMSKSWWLGRVKDTAMGLVGLLPLVATYILFNRLRFGGTGTSGYTVDGNIPLPTFPQAYVIFEGIWGLLFSPGKSIFLFSPILISLFIFGYKLSKKILPELIAFVTLTLTYLWFIGTLRGGVDFLVWHGESSWGPRYMLPMLPLAIVLIATIYTKLNRLQKTFIFYPLIAIGLAIEIIGVSLPYQVRFYALPYKAEIAERKVHISEFGNIIPRYSPVFNMSRLFFKRLLKVPRFYNYGPYQTKLIDGFEQPFDVGFSVWREPLDTAYISFNDSKRVPIQEIAVQLKNQQINPESSVAARLVVSVNDSIVSDEVEIPIETEKEIKLKLDSSQLNATGNLLKIDKMFVSTTSAFLKNKQVVFLQILRINGLPQPIDTMNYPYVSPVSQKLFGATYRYFGQEQVDPWTIWHMHSGIYEKSFDFWWLRPLHYWDMPKSFYGVLLFLNIAGMAFWGKKIWTWTEVSRSQKKNRVA